MCYNMNNMEGNMSKKLIKIISICAIAVLVPLVILGVALSVSYNKSVVLSIFNGGDEIVDGTTSEVAIFVDNEKQTSNKVTLKKGTEVTVTWEGEGFVFNGWFDGNESEAQGKTAESEKASYTFALKSNKVLTAIKSYKAYTLNVRYKNGSNDVDTISYTRPSGENVGGFGEYTKSRAGYTFAGFKYGENVYSPTNGDYLYNGTSLSNALLASSTYSLDVTAVWNCNYENFNINYETDVNNHDVWGIKEDGTEVKLVGQLSFNFDDFATDGNDLTDNNMIDVLFGEYSSFFIKEGGNNVPVNLSLKNIKIAVNDGNVNLYDASADDPISTWIEAFEITKGIETLQQIQLISDDFIRVIFTFEKV